MLIVKSINTTWLPGLLKSQSSPPSCLSAWNSAQSCASLLSSLSPTSSTSLLVIVVLVMLLGCQSKEFDQSKPRRYCPWHGDGAPSLRFAVGWPTALLGQHLVTDVVLPEISWCWAVAVGGKVPYGTQYIFLCWIHSLCVGWRNMCELPLFFRESLVSCYYCVALAYVLFFEQFLIHNSRGFMILKNNWPNLLGLCHFLFNT